MRGRGQRLFFLLYRKPLCSTSPTCIHQAKSRKGGVGFLRSNHNTVSHHVCGYGGLFGAKKYVIPELVGTDCLEPHQGWFGSNPRPFKWPCRWLWPTTQCFIQGCSFSDHLRMAALPGNLSALCNPQTLPLLVDAISRCWPTDPRPPTFDLCRIFWWRT